MRLLLLLSSLLMLSVACSSSPKGDYENRKAEAQAEYEEEMSEAKEDYKEEQKEEAEEYVEESEEATIKKEKSQVDVVE
jgi:Tfp pilus assembly protein PilP